MPPIITIDPIINSDVPSVARPMGPPLNAVAATVSTSAMFDLTISTFALTLFCVNFGTVSRIILLELRKINGSSSNNQQQSRPSVQYLALAIMCLLGFSGSLVNVVSILTGLSSAPDCIGKNHAFSILTHFAIVIGEGIILAKGALALPNSVWIRRLCVSGLALRSLVALPIFESGFVSVGDTATRNLAAGCQVRVAPFNFWQYVFVEYLMALLIIGAFLYGIHDYAVQLKAAGVACHSIPRVAPQLPPPDLAITLPQRPSNLSASFTTLPRQRPHPILSIHQAQSGFMLNSPPPSIILEPRSVGYSTVIRQKASKTGQAIRNRWRSTMLYCHWISVALQTRENLRRHSLMHGAGSGLVIMIVHTVVVTLYQLTSLGGSMTAIHVITAAAISTILVNQFHSVYIESIVESTLQPFQTHRPITPSMTTATMTTRVTSTPASTACTCIDSNFGGSSEINEKIRSISMPILNPSHIEESATVKRRRSTRQQARRVASIVTYRRSSRRSTRNNESRQALGLIPTLTSS